MTDFINADVSLPEILNSFFPIPSFLSNSNINNSIDTSLFSSYSFSSLFL